MGAVSCPASHYLVILRDQILVWIEQLIDDGQVAFVDTLLDPASDEYVVFSLRHGFFLL
jgi:hypothetical protein